MPDIKIREEKIQEKRKQKNFREFLIDIASWQPLSVYKTQGGMSRYPESGREGKIVSISKYDSTNVAAIQYQQGNFFYNLQELFQHQEKMNLMQRFTNENCDYAEVYGAKNCYLSFSVGANAENVCYSMISGVDITNIYNALSVYQTSNLYTSTMVSDSFNIFYANNIHGSNNIRFSNNLVGCHECILCDGLLNVSYYIENKAYPKDEYLQKKKEILLQKENYQKFHRSVIQKGFANQISSDVTGAGIFMSQHITNGYFVKAVKGGKNLFVAGGNKSNSSNLYDCFDVGFEGDNYDFYGVHYCGEGSNNIYTSSSISHCSHVLYSYFLENCSFCLGCVGLKNKSFCILNKQYSKDERFTKANKTFEEMAKQGMIGQFLPGRMNPFYFNDTAAYLIDNSFTKEEVTQAGYLRRDEEIKVDIPQGADIIGVQELNNYQGFDTDGNRQINPKILKKVIRDEKGNYYRIIPMELEFLQKHGLPLPEIHRLERIKLGFKFK